MPYMKLKLDNYEAATIRELVLSEYWRLRRQRSKIVDPELHEIYLFLRRLELRTLRRLLKKIDKLLGIAPKPLNN